MFRAATRALPATRAVLQRRTMASAAKPNPEAGFTWVVGMPVDVYPLAGIVTVACSGSFYRYWSLRPFRRADRFASARSGGVSAQGQICLVLRLCAVWEQAEGVVGHQVMSQCEDAEDAGPRYGEEEGIAGISEVEWIGGVACGTEPMLHPPHWDLHIDRHLGPERAELALLRLVWCDGRHCAGLHMRQASHGGLEGDASGTEHGRMRVMLRVVELMIQLLGAGG
ncbi:unnamed protein product [Cutaneotrichosporon oleaginosum]